MYMYMWLIQFQVKTFQSQVCKHGNIKSIHTNQLSFFSTSLLSYQINHLMEKPEKNTKHQPVTNVSYQLTSRPHTLCYQLLSWPPPPLPSHQQLSHCHCWYCWPQQPHHHGGERTGAGRRHHCWQCWTGRWRILDAAWISIGQPAWPIWGTHYICGNRNKIYGIIVLKCIQIWGGLWTKLLTCPL